MLIVMQPHASEEQVQNVISFIKGKGFEGYKEALEYLVSKYNQ